VTIGRSLILLFLIPLLSLPGFSEPRWCSIASRAPGDTLVYPPIAKAAHVEGVVLTRVSYTTAGLVLGTQTISGPPCWPGLRAINLRSGPCERKRPVRSRVNRSSSSASS
jgi:hypothetical protein